jgi:hypothetical protein
MRVATALRELQVAYNVATPELKKDIDAMFDYISGLQDIIEARLDEEMHPTSLAALKKEAKEAEKAEKAKQKEKASEAKSI